MQTHLPTRRYKGPVTLERGWWPHAGQDDRVPTASVPPLADPDIRTELVHRVRCEIAAGTYDTPEKWEAALDRLLDCLEDK